MQVRLRQTLNHLFTTVSATSIVLLIAALLLFLVPMLGKGAKAVFFKGTVEFRKMQAEQFNRGHLKSLQEESQITEQARQEIYAILDQFSLGIDTKMLADEVKDLYRNYGDELRYKETPKEQYSKLRKQVKTARNYLLDAFESIDKTEINERLDSIENLWDKDVFTGTSAEKIFTIATDYRHIIKLFIARKYF